MESEHFAELDERGADYWWFATRFEVAWRLALEAGNSVPRSVVDLGCGTGTFLSWLTVEKRLPPSSLLGLEAADAGLAAAKRRGIPAKRFDLEKSDLSDVLIEPPDTYFALDVLEHIDEPVRVLSAAHAVANRHTLMIVTVPALPALWSKWDVRLGHYRRYTRRTLEADLRAGGWRPIKLHYLFFAMVLPGLIRRVVSSGQHAGDPGFPLVSAPLNALLTKWSLAEAKLGAALPLGTSLVAVAARMP